MVDRYCMGIKKQSRIIDAVQLQENDGVTRKLVGGVYSVRHRVRESTTIAEASCSI